MMKNIKYYFEKAQKEKFAIGQFNFSDFTQMKAIVAKLQNLNRRLFWELRKAKANFLV